MNIIHKKKLSYLVLRYSFLLTPIKNLFMKIIKIFGSVLVVALALVSCSGGGDDSSTTAPQTTVTNHTYTANIKSNIDGNCTSCSRAVILWLCLKEENCHRRILI